jgi:site-specific DNA recombinase
MRAAGYFRVSTARQGTEEHFSLPVQRDLYLKRCVEKGYEVGPEYVDTESGRTASRRGYQQMLADARAGKFDVIVVRSIDRFGRDQDEILERTAELRGLHIRIDAIRSAATEEMPKTTARFMASIEAFLAEQESVQISGRVLTAMAKSAQAGNYQGGPAPYGYRVVEKKLVPLESEANVVRRMYAWYADENCGARTIARMLNEQGVLTRSGVPWSQETVKGILSRETYMGTTKWGDVVIPNGCPAIVDPETFERARSRSRRRSGLPRGQTHTSEYLLTGLVWCECGSRMNGRASGKYRGYVCKAWAQGHGMPSNWHRADELEQRVIDRVVGGLPLHQVEGQPSPVEGLKEERAVINRQLAAFEARRKQAFAGYTNGVFSDETFSRMAADLQAEENTLTMRMTSLDMEIADSERAAADLKARPERLQSLLSDDTTPQEKKAVLHTYCEKVTVFQGVAEPVIRLR